MKKLLVATALAAVLSISMAAFYQWEEKMLEVKFILGNNIHETAKSSGAPRFSTRNIAGLVSYELANIPADIPFLYQKKDYEIRALPLFAFTMYADHEDNDNLAVKTVDLQFRTDDIKSHASAKPFIESLISQFQSGKWRRYVPATCPAVSGRSSILDVDSNLIQTGYCPLDPDYRIPMDAWLKIIKFGQRYQWLGEGVLATLEIQYDDDIRGITYAIDLSFDDLAAKTKQDDENQARELAEGDANGWNSTAKYKKDMQAAMERVKVLEVHARKRGDSVMAR